MPASSLESSLDTTTDEEVRTIEVGRSEGCALVPDRYAAGYLLAGKYRLEQPIARGGMGQVWLARNVALDVDVAVKLIRAEVASARASERLLTEARAVARLGHRAIVRVFDYGTTEHGDPYLVMELIEGERLDTVLAKRKRLPAVHAVQMLLPVASALAAAHAKNIVHRDVKPDNILLTHDEVGFIVPKLLDFGIAKLREEGRSTLITDEGVTIGSPAYMAPEQALGAADVDVRADVWGLCTVLYQATTGQRPFGGGSYRAVMDSILRASPVPMPVLGAGNEELWQVVSRGLAKERDDRWPSMRELGRALSRWLIDQGIESDATGTSLRLQWHGDHDRPSRPSEVLAPVSEPSLPPIDPWVPFDAEPEVEPPEAGRWVGPAVLGAALLLAGTVGVAFAVSGEPEAAPAPTVAASPREAAEDEETGAFADGAASPADEAQAEVAAGAEDDVGASDAGAAAAEPDAVVESAPAPRPKPHETTPAAPPPRPVAPAKPAPPPKPAPPKPAPPKPAGSLPLPAQPDF